MDGVDVWSSEYPRTNTHVLLLDQTLCPKRINPLAGLENRCCERTFENVLVYDCRLSQRENNTEIIIIIYITYYYPFLSPNWTSIMFN